MRTTGNKLAEVAEKKNPHNSKTDVRTCLRMRVRACARMTGDKLAEVVEKTQTEKENGRVCAFARARTTA